jgi:hypothetical protein
MIWVGRSPCIRAMNKDGLPTSRPVENHGAKNHTVPPGRIYGHTILALNCQAAIIQSLQDKSAAPGLPDGASRSLEDGAKSGVNSNLHRHQSLRILAPSFSV